jgi:Glyoxalase/Bleomycin resistance protein/Dioxygenase superfamily
VLQKCQPERYCACMLDAESQAGIAAVQVMLRVSNLDKSIEYYETCLGMQLLRKRENPGAHPVSMLTLIYLAFRCSYKECVALYSAWQSDVHHCLKLIVCACNRLARQCCITARIGLPILNQAACCCRQQVHACVHELRS